MPARPIGCDDADHEWLGDIAGHNHRPIACDDPGGHPECCRKCAKNSAGTRGERLSDKADQLRPPDACCPISRKTRFRLIAVSFTVGEVGVWGRLCRPQTPTKKCNVRKNLVLLQL